MINIGSKIPDFSIPSTDNTHWTNETIKGKYLIIYFYPKDSTPGCTKEGLAFTELYSQFQSLGAEIVGVSRDSLKKHENFIKKQGFSFQLLSDSDETLCNIFDVIKLKKLYGKEYLGIERSTFLISPEGILIKEWRKVKVAGHAEEVLHSLEEIIG
ncbi:MAG: peroxiredoxin [bacterium]